LLLCLPDVKIFSSALCFQRQQPVSFPGGEGLNIAVYVVINVIDSFMHGLVFHLQLKVSFEKGLFRFIAINHNLLRYIHQV
jgi:hypothetical protein